MKDVIFGKYGGVICTRAVTPDAIIDGLLTSIDDRDCLVVGLQDVGGPGFTGPIQNTEAIAICPATPKTEKV